MIRSILATLAGFATWTVLFLVGNQVLFAVFADRYRDDLTTDDPAALFATLVLSVIASIGAGWVTATLAKVKISPHTLALGLVLLAVGIFVQLSYWNTIPVWYHLSFLALLIPATILGGKLRGGR